ncbi:helix-turn-helix domain-containing protein [Acidisoma cladoniae]|jgi:transcriptional regulator GlxA family with amidase domain|uniref:helix-turn-helix domain-containing protein n=1 Tax=Acidisoma cladoniae TaxID=3040935 RepID=UPI00254DAD3F|nr:helix-turn-helix domain-containing protein [Acidisoma sp. PAMC 29798]
MSESEGRSPAKAIETLRVEAAQTLMEQSRHPIDVVAQQTGFSDRDHLPRAFLRGFGQPPQVLRRQAWLWAGTVKDGGRLGAESEVRRDARGG